MYFQLKNFFFAKTPCDVNREGKNPKIHTQERTNPRKLKPNFVDKYST